MPTVSTSTSVSATRGGRLTARYLGTDWVALYSLASTRWEFWYSTNNGASWTESTARRITVSGNVAGALDVSRNGDVVFAYGTGTSVGLAIQEGAGPLPSDAWTRIKTRNASASNVVDIDMVVCGQFTTTIAVVMSVASGAVFCGNTGLDAASGFPMTFLVSGLSGGGQVAIDWSHTGDGRTFSSATCFITYRMTAATVMRKSNTLFIGDASTFGAERTIASVAAAATDSLTATFDGSRFIMAFIDDTSDTAVKWFERDAADTVTTSRTPSALSDGAITSLGLAVTPAGNTRLFAVGTTSDDVRICNYDRAANTFSAFVLFNATTATGLSMSVQRGFSSGYSVVWTSGAGSPFNVVFERSAFAAAPNAPGWTSPTNSSAQDVAASLLLDWAYSNIDPSDTQSAYALFRSVNAAALQYYNAAAGTWGASEVKNVTTTTNVTLATAWATDGQSTVYAVKTWSAADLPGPYGSGLTIIGSALVVPTITAPANSATLATATATVTWTVAEQTAYQIRFLTLANALLYATGKVTDVPTRSLAVAYTLANGLTNIKVELTTWNTEDLSATDTNTEIGVTYVTPLVPTLTVTANSAGAFTQVAINDPAFGPSPQVASHDIFVRVAPGGRVDGERPAGGDGIRIARGVVEDGTYLDYAAGMGIDYQYRTLAVAVNGTAVFSAWT